MRPQGRQHIALEVDMRVGGIVERRFVRGLIFLWQVGQVLQKAIIKPDHNVHVTLGVDVRIVAV